MSEFYGRVGFDDVIYRFPQKDYIVFSDLAYNERIGFVFTFPKHWKRQSLEYTIKQNSLLKLPDNKKKFNAVMEQLMLSTFPINRSERTKNFIGEFLKKCIDF